MRVQRRRLGCCAVESNLRRRALTLRALTLLAGLAAAGAGALAAQTALATRPTGPLLASRAVLERRAAVLERAGPSGVAELAQVRRRLTEGDFQVGDRVLLRVEGETELTDTFTVGADRDLALPGMGPISLRGVLRAELERALTTEIGKYVRDPAVRAAALVMVSVTGEVNTPGFYPLRVNALLSDVVMAAGGGTRDAKLKDLRIERGGAVVWNARAVSQAIREGHTLDDVGLRSGDQFVIPGRARGSPESTLRVMTLLLSIPVTIYTLTRIF
jgi:protein involved in polysaccharide export with SLBB domain